jgi:NAD(P)-dependent dehydrogenase (short-subunit alcohol dehydrogenase family)
MSSNKVVITGVSRGLGLAMVDQFIQRGHVVAGCARSAVAIQQLNQRYGSPHNFQTVDVSDDAHVHRWARLVLDHGGPPDLLVNNAALINSSASLWQVPAEEFSQVIDVNIKGVFHVIRHFVPAMIERGRGVIVNFSSGWGRSTSPEVAPYCATKWAIEGLTKALADELPEGLAAIPVNPGVIHTEMLETCFGLDATSYPSPEQWARRAVPFLLDLGPQHNGQSATVL